MSKQLLKPEDSCLQRKCKQAVTALSGSLMMVSVYTVGVVAAEDKAFSGNVSWYGAQFNGKKTASGERFDITKPTAAHRKLPFQTKVLVEDPKTGHSVVVKVNDRGPFVKSRVMDLSREGARRLGTLSKGVTYVDCTIIED